MKISYNWLKNYIPTDLTPEKAAEYLTDAGLEVEGIEKIETIRGGLQGLLVAEVLTCTDHPDSDHLHITTVNTGEGEPIQVVCGAPNVAAGQKVILATVGATLYPTGTEEGFKIKKSKIRGAESHGMICAEDEIGVGASHDGIIILPADTKTGMSARDYFGVGDQVVFEIGLTPNRIDASSHYGVARDLAAYLSARGSSIRAQLPDVSAFTTDNNSMPAEVTVEDPKAAPRYMGVTIKGVTPAPSPEWLQKALLSIGINPKNNIVDITNFVMYECGQPLHAFDFDKVDGGQIIVKKCPEGTPFVTLDGVERKLSAEDLMICSATKPMCIAGVFGGIDSGVSDTTRNVFLESAYFNAVTVRKSARRHGLNTDSSFRYERGTDPQMPPYALKRAALLIKELAGGEISSDVVDLYPEPVEPFRFEISYSNINRLIGKEIPRQTVLDILKGLEIAVETETDGKLLIAVPAYRVDVQREADVIEDILRIYGYNNVENPHFIKTVITAGNQQTTEKLVEAASQMLSSMGMTEIMSNSLTKAVYYDGMDDFKQDGFVRILNPLSNDLNVMRRTLLFNAMEAIVLNSNRRNSDLKMFEIGKTYHYDASKSEQGGLKPYSEIQKLAITVTGAEHQASWNAKSQMSDFFTLKNFIEKIFERFGLNFCEGRMETLKSDLYDEGISYTIRGSRLFEMGIVSRKVRTLFDVKAPVYYLELDVVKLQKLANTVKVRISDLSKFQPVKRDLALLIDKSVTFDSLRELASKAEKKLLKSVSLFDVYEGDKLPAGKKSYALSFVIEDQTKTLNDAEIERVMSTIALSLEKGAGAVIRS